MNSREQVLEALGRCRTSPSSIAQIQEELTGSKLTYATTHNCISELVRQGKITETRNAVDKRVFQLKG